MGNLYTQEKVQPKPKFKYTSGCEWDEIVRWSYDRIQRGRYWHFDLDVAINWNAGRSITEDEDE